MLFRSLVHLGFENTAAWILEEKLPNLPKYTNGLLVNMSVATLSQVCARDGSSLRKRQAEKGCSRVKRLFSDRRN